MIVRLGDICTVVSGTTPQSNNPAYWDGDIDWITPAELNDDSCFIYESQRKITELAVRESRLTPFPKGTVILSSRAPIGKVAIAGKKMYCNQGFKNLICSDQIYNKYLYWFFKSKTAYLNSLGRGATFKEISKAIVEDIKIPLPAKDMQIKISSIFDKITDIILLRKRQLSKLDELVKSRFVEMFGDPISNPKGWNMVELGELTSVGSSKRIFEKEYVSEGVPFYRTKEIVELSKGNSISTELFITKKRFAEIKEQYGAPKAGDLLISAVGTIGVIWIVDGKNDFYFKDGNLIRVDGSDRFNSIYMKNLLEYLIAEYKKQMSSGTAYAALTISGLTKMKVYDAPLKFQNAFADFCHQIDKSKSEIQKSLEKLEILKKSLMQKYFG